MRFSVFGWILALETAGVSGAIAQEIPYPFGSAAVTKSGSNASLPPWMTTRSITFDAPFEVVGGRLAIVSVRNVDPFEAGLRLVYITEATQEVIQDLSKLRGKVRIKTTEDALAFARLYTCPGTYYLFTLPKPEALEVIAREAVPSYYNFGNHHGDFMPTDRNGMCGLIDMKLAKSKSIPLAQVKRDGKGFLITRTLLVEEMDSRYLSLERVVERVDESGSYQIVRREMLPRKLVHVVNWVFPRHM